MSSLAQTHLPMLSVIVSSLVRCSGIADFVHSVADIEDFVVAVAVGSKRNERSSNYDFIIAQAQVTPN